MGITDEEDDCDWVNLVMLSGSDAFSVTPDGGSCIVSKPDEPGSFTVQDCDCSDPKNYDFYNKGRF